MKQPLNNISKLFAAAAIIAFVSSAQAAGWGTLKGKFVIDGAAPKLAAIDASKDAVCVAAHPVDQSVVVGKDGGLADVVVFLKVARGKKVDVNPEYDATKSQAVTLDNKGCSFHPHITLVRTDQPFIVKNSDSIAHNTKLELNANGGSNPLLPAGDQKDFKFEKPEAIPLPVSCNIHPFMHGFVLVKDDPYMAVSAEDGTFEIKDIPAGKQEFVFWQEVPGYLKDLKFKGGSTSKQGRAELTIEDGKTLDLGEIKVPASQL